MLILGGYCTVADSLVLTLVMNANVSSQFQCSGWHSACVKWLYSSKSKTSVILSGASINVQIKQLVSKLSRIRTGQEW